jgi:hypothetical protein
MMDSLTSMKTKLKSTGLYSAADGSNLEKELKAYASGLDKVFDELDTMERECYIDTAETYGLSTRESFFGYDRSDSTVEERREILKTEEQLSGDCTVEAFYKIMEGYGLKSYKIVEKYSGNALVVYVYDSMTDEEKTVLESRMSADFPVHLSIVMHYESE